MQNPGLVTLKQPNSTTVEKYKMLRTNLDLNSKDIKTLLITSASAEDGRTEVGCNLAITIAQTGKKVLLLEGNLRNPKIHNLLGLAQAPGLYEILTTNKSISEIVNEIPSCKGLSVLTAGEISNSPSEMLDSEGFRSLLNKVKESYDFIVIDAPPVIKYTDAAILSKLVDGVLMVVVSNKTKKNLADNAIKALEQVGANILGAVMVEAVRTLK